MSKKTRKSLNIILDLDETLINSQALEDITPQEKKKFMRRFKNHNMDGYYLVCERPHVQDFLDYVFKNFNVSVWTAASELYAKFVIKNVILVKPERKLEYFFWDKHCKISRKKFNKQPKNLNLLINKLPDFHSDNTFIIDDLDEVYKPQKCNSIPAIAFDVSEQNSDGDKFLQTIIPILEKLRMKYRSNRPQECLTGQCHELLTS